MVSKTGGKDRIDWYLRSQKKVQQGTTQCFSIAERLSKMKNKKPTMVLLTWMLLMTLIRLISMQGVLLEVFLKWEEENGRRGSREGGVTSGNSLR